MTKINDPLYFLLTAANLKEQADTLGVTYDDIPKNTLFKQKLYLRLKRREEKQIEDWNKKTRRSYV